MKEKSHAAVGFVKLYKIPNFSSEVISSLDNGDYVSYINSGENVTGIKEEVIIRDDINDPWFFVEAESGKRGWCPQVYLKETKSTNDNPEVPMKNFTEEFSSNLEKENLGQYFELFVREHLVNKETLSSIDENDLEKIGISILGDRKKIIKILHGFTEELLEISKSDILTINGKQILVRKMTVADKRKFKIMQFIGIIILILSTLPFHIVIGYGSSGIKIFTKDHLTFENTIVTTDTVKKLLRRYNNVSLFEKVQMQRGPLFRKLMDEGIIYRENK
jgi:hypothetical protein